MWRLRRFRDWRWNRRQVADLLMLLAFIGILMTPWQGLPRLCGYLLALLILMQADTYRSAFDTRTAWFAGALICYLLLTSFWSDDFDALLALRFAIRALVVVCFLAAYADCVRRGACMTAIGRWLAVAGGLAAMGAIAVFSLDSLPVDRLYGLGQARNPVTASLAFAAVALFAADAFWRGGTAMWRGLTAAAALLAIAAVLLTGSRTGWSALLVGGGALFAAYRTAGVDRWRVAMVAWAAPVGVLLASVGILAVAVAANDQIREWLLPRGDSFRFVIWESILHDLMENGWLAGRGILTDNNVEAASMTFRHPHNMYISVFFQGGIVGLALYLHVLAWTAWSLLRRIAAVAEARLAVALLMGGSAGWLVEGHQLLESPGTSWLFFWIPVATAMGIAWRELSEAGSDAEPGQRRDAIRTRPE